MKNYYKNTKTRIFSALTFGVVLISTIFFSCKKQPFDGVKLIVTANVIKNSMFIDVQDAAKPTTIPQNVNISFSGPDAQYIYEMSGKQTFKVIDGKIGIGVDPARVITPSSPVKVNITLSATGYMPITQQLVIKSDQAFQIKKIKLINLASPPPGYDISVVNIPLVNGVTSAQTTLKAFSNEGAQVNSSGKLHVNDTYSDGNLSSIVLPKGTIFYYYTWEKTGVNIQKHEGEYLIPNYASENVPLSPGNGTFTYTRVVSYYKKKYSYTDTTDVYTSTQHTVGSGDNLKAVFTYTYTPGSVKTADKPYSVYPYNFYTPINLKLLSGANVSEDQILYKSAVLQRLTNVSFIVTTADGKDHTADPDQQSKWFTSFVLDPNFINPLTGKKIAAGDSIEAGIDVEHNKTLHIAVKSAVYNKVTQLRAETQTTDVGYYYQAPYLQDYSYNFDTSSSLSFTDIPDFENLYSYGYLNVLTGGQYVQGVYFGIYPNSGVYTFNGKVRSFNPIQISGGTNVSYWGHGQSQSISGSQGSLSPFPANLNLNLQPLTTFNVKLLCSKNDKEFLGQAFAYVSSNGIGKGYAYMSNGVWQTRGLVPGQTYTATVYQGSDKGEWTATIDHNIFTELFKDKFDVCGNL